MIDESIQDINIEEQEKAEEELKEAWGLEVDEKLERLLEYRITESVGGIESEETQRVIIYYKPKKEFEDLTEQFEDYLEGLEMDLTDPEVLERTFDEEIEFIERVFEEDARRLIESLEEEKAEVEEHLVFGNAVVANLTPAQIKEAAGRTDVERIEADKFISMELDQSIGTVDLVNARSQGLVETGKGIIIAVIDGEVDKDHSDLKGRVVHKRNYTKEPWGNPHRHGTHVAGIIAGNGKKYNGVAPDATIWSYKIYPSAETESSDGFKGADAIEDAVKDGAKVINCSWGASQTAQDGTCVWCTTAERAAKLGVVLVKSAGNKGPDESTITCPAAAKGDVIVVGASSHDGTGVMDFSSRGPTKDNRPKPDIIAPGDNITACMEGSDHKSYRRMSGTSMASPHVAGIAALMLERNPQLKPGQIKAILMGSAKALSDYDINTQGKGLVDVVKAAESLKKPISEEGIFCTIVKERQQRERLNISLKNTGREEMQEVKGILVSGATGIKVISEEASFGNLRSGAEKAAVYEIEVGPDTKAGSYELTLNAKYRTKAGESKELPSKLSYEVGGAKKTSPSDDNPTKEV